MQLPCGQLSLSNASRRQRTYWPRLPVSRCFDGTFLSAEVGVMKPPSSAEYKVPCSMAMPPCCGSRCVPPGSPFLWNDDKNAMP